MFAMSIVKLFVSALAVLAYADSALAKPQPHKRAEALASTNAERLRLGQPPLPPRSLKPATPVIVARGSGHRPQPSGGSVSTTEKCIRVKKKSNNNWVGYISRHYERYKGSYTLTDDKDKCLEVKVPNSGDTFDLKIDNANGNKRYLGIAKSSSTNYAVPVKAEQSDSSITNGNSNENETPFSQSTIWSKSGSNGLLASWRSSPTSSLTFTTTYIRTGASGRLYFAIGSDFTSTYHDEIEVSLELVNP